MKDAGAADIAFVCVVAAPEGRRADARPITPTSRRDRGALDRELNADAFILPGLGDFGDRLYGTL